MSDAAPTPHPAPGAESESPSGAAAGSRSEPALNPELLECLRCPMDPTRRLRLEGWSLVCEGCGTRFGIEDDIPNMMIEEAELPPGVAVVADLPCARAREGEAAASDAK